MRTMICNMIIAIMFAVGCSTDNLPTPGGGDGVGSGGDGSTAEFREYAMRAAEVAERNQHQFKDVSIQKIKYLAENAEIQSTEEPLFLDGVEKDAINYKEKRLIVFNRNRFESYEKEETRLVLALHELLGLAGYDDAKFQLSSKMIGYDPLKDKFLYPKVDILFVIDDSGSMEFQQKNLSDHVDYFIAELNDRKIDYHFGVITTTTYEIGDTGEGNGRLRGNPRYVTNRTPFGLASIKKNVLVGIQGSTYERPLDAITRSFEPEMLAGHNSGFFREDARLEIVIISDATDQSPTTGKEFVSDLRQFKGQAVTVSFFIPLPGDHTCNTGFENTDYQRYFTIMKALNGGMFSLCTDFWSTEMRTIGESIADNANSN